MRAADRPPPARMCRSLLRSRAPPPDRRAAHSPFSAHCDELEDDEPDVPVSYCGFAVTHSPAFAAFSSKESLGTETAALAEKVLCAAE